jgi:uncharacterized protein (TIGR01244 family)
MNNFRQLSQTMFASPQIHPGDIAAAKELGINLVINNRPDGESPDEPQGADIEAAALAAGMSYLAIPISHSGFSEPQVEKMQQALAENSGGVLAYCRSGTRSTLLWALAQARSGSNPEELVESAQAAGYDLSPVRPAMDMFASQADQS